MQERLAAVSAERRAMHHRERPGVQGGKPLKRRVRAGGVGDGRGRRSPGVRIDCFPGTLDDLGAYDRLRIARMKEEVRAEQSPLGLVEEEAGIPAVRDVRRREKPEPVTAGLENLAVREGAREPDG